MANMFVVIHVIGSYQIYSMTMFDMIETIMAKNTSFYYTKVYVEYPMMSEPPLAILPTTLFKNPDYSYFHRPPLWLIYIFIFVVVLVVAAVLRWAILPLFLEWWNAPAAGAVAPIEIELEEIVAEEMVPAM
ncbi:uncharacterized protein [Cicer arietinum]|uniref:uncharacterized protein n=1 Tax=Cicer arietinum TaxID=3827 RepID=UPI003CC50FEA